LTNDAIVLDGVTAGYGQATVLRDLNLRVGEGEVVALLGPNGAGKTTTLLTISGLLSPRKGSVLVLGEPPPRRSRSHRLVDRGVVHVPENRGLFSQLTVKQNLLLGPGAGRAEVEQAVALMPELGPLLERRTGLLSGGEQQMLALTRALVARPRVLLIDEMSLGLAPVIVERLLPFARQAASEGAAVLMVEQHTDLALSVADRAYVLVHGEMALEGDADHLLRNRHLLDAAFLGYE